MKILLDQGLPIGAVKILEEAGIDAVHASSIGLSKASDLDILAYAEKHEMIIVTLDADFHALIAISGKKQPSVIRIREEGLRSTSLSILLINILNHTKDKLGSGVLITATLEKLRIRKLPIL